jgi:hypothetical protein
MTDTVRKPAPLEFKPNLDEVDRRFQAYFAGDLIDRPILLVHAPKPGAPRLVPITYHDRVFSDIDSIIDRALEQVRCTYYGGEAIPRFGVSLGTDEIGVFCSDGDFQWENSSGDTNWSDPFVEDWDAALPFRIHERNPRYQRLLQLYRRAAERLSGKMLIGQIDTHSNMDLLMSARGSERLCEDLLDCPEVIDRAMISARAIFPQLWQMMCTEGRMDQSGFGHDIFSMEGAACLQCDFSCMISPEMFRRWVIPALEEEAAIVKHVLYHWDGPTALRHVDDLCATKGLHTLAYVPGDGRGRHTEYLDVYEHVQKLGKAVFVWGSPDEIKLMHRRLKPNKTMYTCWTSSINEARELEQWLVDNT